VGSFSINGQTGLWADFATGDKGDLISLVVAAGHAPTPVKAAELIVKALGGELPAQNGNGAAPSHLDKPKRAKVKAVIPVPEDKLALIRSVVKETWAVEHHGKATAGYTYRDAEGGIVFCVSRFEKPDKSKDIVPYYFGEDGRWHEGQALETGRPVYRLNEIAKADRGTPILVVEGEKCAAVAIEGWLVTTWAGGALATTKTDWAPLEGRTVLIWPDADEPGLKAARAISNRLPMAKVMDIVGKPKGWDLADAVADGVDPLAFIADTPVYGGPPPADSKRPDDGLPFRCLGYDEVQYYFLPSGTRMPYTIPLGVFRTTQMQQLAPLSWWAAQNLTSDQGNLKQSHSMDMLVGIQNQVGFFDPKNIRGAGVWRDSDGIILNDGRRIVTMAKESVAFDDFKSRFCYVPSKVQFGETHGPQSSDEDGRQLERLFTIQEFRESSMPVLLMGWALISAFAGVLKWRPHIWVTGSKGTGKSWLFDELVKPLCGPFAYVGSGGDTEAGIRRTLNNDARPALLAEMEPKSKKALEKIVSILELVRNASDNSAVINMSGPGGGAVSFSIRSMFALNSTMIPDSDGATDSRITRVELRTGVDFDAKRALSTEILDGGLLDDPGRFRRRIFHALPQILADIEHIKMAYRGIFGTQRAVDQVAPMLAAAWAAQSSASVMTSGLWIERHVAELSSETKRVEDDEDSFMRLLLGSKLMTDKKNIRTVAELLLLAEKGEEQPGDDEYALALLERHGITMRRQFRVDPLDLFIATKSAAIAAMMKDTPYAAGYAFQVRRHKLAQGGNGQEVRMAGTRIRCQRLDWEEFRRMYLEDAPREEDSEGGPPF
jgi:hypothetical protein